MCLLAAGHTAKCPNCGFEAKPVDRVRVIDGELRELDGNKRGITNPAEVYGQFKFIGIQRNYKPGWAYHKSEEYLGCKPVRFDAAPLVKPSPEILRWEKSRRIAWWRGQANREAPARYVHTQPASLTALSSTVSIGGYYQSKDPDDVPF
jgi:DNA repair protein RadD